MKASEYNDNIEKSSEEKNYRLQGKSEKVFLDRCRKISDLVINSHPNSQQEGFEYFFRSYGGKSPMQIRGRKGTLRFIRVFAKYGRKLMRERKKSYEDIETYLSELEKNGKFTSRSDAQNLLKSYPNANLWLELQDYAETEWDIIKIGFTELPSELIFRNKMVLFRYALVFMQEMKKEKIDKAPEMEAGEEKIRIYAELGEAVANIAE